MKKKIAITGGIGSGKSSVLSILREMGYAVFSCDEIYRKLIDLPEYIEKIGEVFPRCVKNGKICKQTLAQRVFNNKAELEILNGIAHPLIMSRLLQQMNEIEENLIFAEVPLLFEGNFESLFDQIVVVLRNRDQRIQAIMDRDGVTIREAEKRISAQFNYDDPSNMARFEKDGVFCIQNNASLAELKNDIQKIIFTISNQ